MSKVDKELSIEENMDTIPQNKKGFLVWIKSHKKQLILAGVSITTIVGIILGIKNKGVLMELWESLAESIRKVPASTLTSVPMDQSSVPALELVAPVRQYTSPKEAVDIRQHIRTMAAGCYHSSEKAAEAATLGIELLPNQTLVSAYTKCAA